MKWSFYWRRLIYISPYWLFSVSFMLTLITQSLEKMRLPHEQMFYIAGAIIAPAIFIWLLTPFTFFFIESFRLVRKWMIFQKAPPVNFESRLPFSLWVIWSSLGFIIHHTLELTRYVLICCLVITCSVVISPVVIIVLMMESVLKKMPTDPT